MTEAHLAPRFRGCRALVTGGSKGIGRAIAIRLAREGADVAITWFRDRESAEKTTAELQEIGVDAIAIKAHLGKPNAVAEIIEQTSSAIGEPELVVSNAASGVQRPLAEVSTTHWEWTMDVNAKAFLELSQACPSATSILALTSLGSSRVMQNYGIVGASKAALESLVRYLAVERAPNCRVNAISPGVVETDSLRKFPAAEAILQEARSKTPAGRLVAPDDVAGLAAFLLSNEAEMITGQSILIDGGFSVRA